MLQRAGTFYYSVCVRACDIPAVGFAYIRCQRRSHSYVHGVALTQKRENVRSHCCDFLCGD